MSRSVIVTAVTVAALILSGVAAQAAAVTPKPAPMLRPVALMCAATKGDVAQTLTITNKTKASLPGGTKINWKINGKTGVQTLLLPLGVGKSTTVLAPPGNGGPCTASYQPK